MSGFTLKGVGNAPQLFTGAAMNDNPVGDLKPRQIDGQAGEPPYYTRESASNLLWGIGLALLVALALMFCA
jgi:hypothetical protein